VHYLEAYVLFEAGCLRDVWRAYRWDARLATGFLPYKPPLSALSLQRGTVALVFLKGHTLPESFGFSAEQRRTLVV
jgi:hypothetical protein